MMKMSEFPFQPGDRVWAYGRDSGGINQQESVDSQMRVIKELCQEYSIKLVHVFTDRARKGSSTVGRDALEDLLYLAQQKPRPVEGIIFWSMARLARAQLDSQFIKADLRRLGYIIYSMTDDIPSGEFGPVIESLIDWKNERFLKDLARNVQRGLGDLARQGYAPGGFPARGYLAEKIEADINGDGKLRVVSRWIPDPVLGPRVTRAFEMRAAGATFKEVHEATHVMGTIGSYVTMFRNKTYLGIRKCGDLEIENAHEPLVSRELWDAVQATLRERPAKGKGWPRGKRHSMRTNSPYLLSGLAVCSVCGAAMVGGKDNVSGGRKTPWVFYLCGRKKRQGWESCPSGKIGARQPEGMVLQAVTRRVLTPTFLTALVAEVNGLMAHDMPLLRGQINEAERQLAELNAAIGNLLDLAERFGAASAGARLLERETEQVRLRTRLQQLVLKQEAHGVVVSPVVVESMLTGLHHTLAGGDLRAKQALLSKVVAKIEMGATGATLSYTFPLER